MTEGHEQRLVDAGKVRELNDRARKLMEEPDFYDNGYALKCMLEELGLWEDMQTIDTFEKATNWSVEQYFSGCWVRRY